MKSSTNLTAVVALSVLEQRVDRNRGVSTSLDEAADRS